MRTPAKNVASLEALRAEVMLMVEENVSPIKSRADLRSLQLPP